MTLEFLDGTQLEVITIIGGPKLIGGVMRDTLQIEVDPSVATLEQLKALFKDPIKCRTLYGYNEAVDESTDQVSTVRETIGEGYTIFVSVADEERRIAAPPGYLQPDTIEEVYVVQIAQLTYAEYMLEHGLSN